MQAEDLTEEEETVVEERRRNMVTVRSAHKVTFFILYRCMALYVN